MITLVLGSNEFDLETLAGLVAHDGWGMAPVQRFSRRGAQQHGDSDAGYLLEPRFGNLVFRMKENSLVGMYSLRKRLMDLFSPLNSPKLRFSLPYGTRQFDVEYAGDMSLPWSVSDWGAQKFGVTLKASDPTCYDPNMGIVREDHFTAGFTSTVNYDGNFDSFPAISLTAEGTIGLKDVVLTVFDPLGVSYKLDFTGYTIPTGYTMVINLAWGQKTVLLGGSTNVIDKLTSDSDLVFWRLFAPLYGATVQANDIVLDMATGAPGEYQGSIIMTYYRRWLGV